MAFSESFLQDLADRNDIVDVVSGYVALTKRSGRNLFGLCPFHSEKTPSFSVSPDKQIFYCFGCGKGGSVINFIMEAENLSFPDAVHFLARRAGMQVPEDRPDPNSRRRERMLELNKEAARFFYNCLIADPGNPAQKYIAMRGISPAMVKKFGLGFAPNTWDSLVTAMSAKGYTRQELLDAGLVRSGKGGGIYDAFRNRLMFPVIDVRGSVIGFSGRILDDGEPKYLNSPDTLVFDKRRHLFAMNLAKRSKSGYIILTEGNIDVVSLHQAGFDSAVASLGTSLTPEQARLISRYAQEVVIAYDSDEAGRKASQRAIEILEKLDLKVRVLNIQGAKDPDEYIKTKGADAFRTFLERSENHIEYRLQAVQSRHDLGTSEGTVDFVKEAARLVAELGSPVEREVYGSRVAETAGVPKEVVEDEVRRQRKLMLKSARKKQEQSALRPVKVVQPKLKSIKYENVRSAAAEEGVIRLLYLDPGLFKDRDFPKKEDFSSELLGRLYEEIRQRTLEGGSLSMAALSESFTADEISHLTGILQKPEMLSNGAKALEDYIEIMRAEKNSLENKDLRLIAEEYRQKKGYGG
jgi:DNA primase